MLKIFSLISVLVLLVSPSVVVSQVCLSGQCDFVQNVPQNASPSVSEIDTAIETSVRNAQSSGPSSGSAVRVSVGNGCGSGSVCGLFRDGCLVLTNAHVAGTRPGSRSVVRAMVPDPSQGGRLVDRQFTGVLLEAAYSDRFLTDWAILYVEGLKDIQPVRLSTKKPNNRMYTKGSPRCVWPLVESGLVVADIRDNSTLVRWRPNSIGGQSGSGCWDVDDNLQRAILTWSWGGLGAGQQTAEIYRQSRNKTVSGSLRDGSEIEVSAGDVVCENGYFAVTDLADFDIWDDGSSVDPVDPIDPVSETHLSPEDRKALESARDTLQSILDASK